MHLDSQEDDGMFLWMDFGVGSHLVALIFSIIFVIAMVVLAIRQNAQQAEDNRLFCAEVCGQYRSESRIHGEECFCKDAQGIYDPNLPRSTQVEK